MIKGLVAILLFGLTGIAIVIYNHLSESKDNDSRQLGKWLLIITFALGIILYFVFDFGPD